MSAADAQAEPTMEEILASIRRIISEDDAGPAAAAPAPAAPLAEVSDFGDDVLELNAPVMAMPETVAPDFDFDALPGEYEPEQGYEDVVIEDRWAEPALQPEPVREAYQPPPRAVPEPVYQPTQSYVSDDGLVSNPIADVTSSVFAKLAPSNVFPEVFASGNSVEALVVAMLRPMLKDWLDANLPRIVEDKVETEVARIARRSF
jgi:uncharacterized protein